MINIKVEKNIPIPTAAKKRNTYGFFNLKIGDSVFIDSANHDSNAAAAAKMYARRNRLKFVMRVMDGGLRIWRTE
jgi:hypothetical protein